MTASHPGASPYRDRHGRTRWRFRANGRSRELPGEPGEAAFESAYRAAILGRAAPKVVTLPGNAGSFADAWTRVRRSDEWRALDPATQKQAARHAEILLTEPYAPGGPDWAAMPMRDLRRRHVKAALAAAPTPVARKRRLTAIRRMVAVALDEEWLEFDPTAGLQAVVTYIGWKAWPDEALTAFDARWPNGTAARLAKEIALTMGDRRGDLAVLRHDQRVVKTVIIDGVTRLVPGYEFTMGKGREGRVLFVATLPSLDAAISAMPVRGETVLCRRDGKPYSAKSLTGWMARWTRLAGLPPGLTLHGLRKTMGRMMAEGGASTRQSMDALGHRAIAHAELYSRQAEQVRMAVTAADRLAERLKSVK